MMQRQYRSVIVFARKECSTNRAFVGQGVTNSSQIFDLVSVLLHWSMAVAVIAMYALGLWMVDRDY